MTELPTLSGGDDAGMLDDWAKGDGPLRNYTRGKVSPYAAHG